MTEQIKQIQSGVFIMPFHDPAKPLAQSFDEDLELIIRADELKTGNREMVTAASSR